MRSHMRPEYSNQPESRIQRSAFDRSRSWKGTFDAGYLIPFYVDEAVPGDVFKMNASFMLRLATSLFPTMDNLTASVHFWSCAKRLLWDNFKKFMGERENPSDSIDYTIPVVSVQSSGNPETFDYLGVAPLGTKNVNTLPMRMYNFTYNEHYKSQDLINNATFSTGDGPDARGDFQLRRRGKRPDYFTTALPSPQKGDSVSLPLGTTAPVVGIGIDSASANANTNTTGVRESDGGTDTYSWTSDNAQGLGSLWVKTEPSTGGDPQIFADLTNAAAATISQFRQNVAIQQFLETDARAGTRFAEIIWGHFGTEYQDVKYRPEYLGGGSFPVVVNPVPNQSGSTGDLGDLAGIGTGRGQGIGFTKAFDEWSYILGIICVDADLTYQQGIDRLWTRSTRYDFFWPEFAFIGDQAIRNDEIYADGSANDALAFGYAPRYEEYRWGRSLVTGLFRSDAVGTLEAWGYWEDFASLPTLGQTFIESNPPVDRTIAVPSEPHFICDSYLSLQCARPMPLSGIPGMTRM